MKRYLINHTKWLVIACVFAMEFVATSTPVSASPLPFSFYGTWRINKIVGYAEVSTGPDGVKKFIGTNVVISRERIKAEYNDCDITQAHESVMKTARFLWERYRAIPKHAGVPVHTLVLHTESCGDVFRRGNDIVVCWDGGFLRASRVDVGKATKLKQSAK